MKPIWALLACLVLYVPGFVAVTQPEPQKGQSVDRNQIPNWPYDPDGSRVYSDSDEPPFDVPPVVSDKWEPPIPKELNNTSGFVANWGCDSVPLSFETKDWICLNGVAHQHIHTETCADKTRFLLHSEDGKGHCLKLVPGDAGAVGTSQ